MNDLSQSVANAQMMYACKFYGIELQWIGALFYRGVRHFRFWIVVAHHLAL